MLFLRLDTLDQGRAIGQMEEMLKAEKYRKKDRPTRRQYNLCGFRFMVGSSWFKISVQDENPCKMGKVQVGSSYFTF